ncbi:hypothetical protein E0Z07_01755 [Myroides odoratimimus]|nr:hypothetical protein E0Z07_01755 [Myroides odoratimimus]
MSRKTEYVHNPCFLSANILKILGVFAENQFFINIILKMLLHKSYQFSLFRLVHLQHKIQDLDF